MALLQAIVMERAPYRGKPGYYIQWDYARPREEWESSGVLLASAMVLVVPVVIAYMFLQRKVIESMAGTGVKG